MKALINLIIVFLVSALSFNVTFADQDFQVFESNTDIIYHLSENMTGSEVGSGELSEKTPEKLNKEEEAIIVKSLNNIIIETYKPIISKFLDILYDNIKEKKKETKLKILSTVIISIKSKTDLINSPKTQISDKKKIILTAIFDYIINDIENKIQIIAKEK